MPKIKVPIYGTVQKSVRIDADANEGATLGVDLRLADGSVATAATLAAALGVGAAAGDGDASPTLWKLIREIPANVIQVEELATSGLVVRQVAGAWVTRSLTTDDGNLISIANPAGAAGNPSVDVNFAAAITWTGAHQFDVGPTVWDGAAYQDVVLDTLGLNNLADPNADRIAFWDDSAGTFAWLAPGANLTITGTTLDATVPAALNDLSDVTIATPAEGQVLQYNATSTDWENTSLVDVSLTSVATGQVLYYDGTEFVNSTEILWDDSLSIGGGAGNKALQIDGFIEIVRTGAASVEFMPDDDTRGASWVYSTAGSNLFGRFRDAPAFGNAANFFSALDGGAVTLYNNGVEELRTAQHDATDFLSGAEVKDFGGTWRQIGFLDRPRIGATGDRTISEGDWGKLIQLATNASTFTFNSAPSVPNDVDLILLAFNVAITIAEGAGVTIRWFDGATSGGATGNRTLAAGGVLAIRKRDDNQYDIIWSVGLS